MPDQLTEPKRNHQVCGAVSTMHFSIFVVTGWRKLLVLRIVRLVIIIFHCFTVDLIRGREVFLLEFTESFRHTSDIMEIEVQLF